MVRSKVIVVVMAVLFCLLMTVPAMADQSNALVTAEDLNGFLNNENVVIIDVRASDAYSAGHIPGAVSVQTSEFYEELDGVKQMAAGPKNSRRY